MRFFASTFFARFDQANNDPIPHIEYIFEESEVDVTVEETKKIINKMGIRKSPGPDGISPKLLKTCVEELSHVLVQIFKWSLGMNKVPKCFKKSVIVPVPKKPNAKELKEFRPVALTSVVMKIFERLVLKQMNELFPADFDQYQFAYRNNRSTDDAIDCCLQYTLQNMEPRAGKKIHARMLFIDYSSAFNTIRPGKLMERLLELNVPTKLSLWLCDFLLDRPQIVRIENNLSKQITLNTGAPQGCVLSPKLFTWFTSDCQAKAPGTLMVKYADDTTLIGIIENGDETSYRAAVSDLVKWSESNYLELNVSKTKEMVIDFKKKKSTIDPMSFSYVNIQGCNILKLFEI